SPFFQDMLDGGHIGVNDEGTSDSRPITLANITASEMESFLDITTARVIIGSPSLSLSGWSAALHLATMWDFERIRAYAISQIDDNYDHQDPLDRIDLAEKCRVAKWLHPAYVKLCERAEPMTGVDGRRLGYDRFAAICKIREMKKPGNATYCCCPEQATTTSGAPLDCPGRTAGLGPIVVIEVDGVPFGIPLSLLEGSPFFKDMLDDSVIGRSSESVNEPAKVHIRLEEASNVKASEMEAFVRLLDTKQVIPPSDYTIFQPRPNLTSEQWASSLYLATVWHLDPVRDFIIQNLDRQIDDIDPLDRIDLTIKCKVEKWLIPAYAALCRQKAPFSDPVALRLGLLRFAALCRIRERISKARFQFRLEELRYGGQILAYYSQLSPVPDALNTVGLIRAEPALAFPGTLAESP
ncbi:hypothetical protein FRB99_000234, partial [Tulasnella sp. 403]